MIRLESYIGTKRNAEIFCNLATTILCRFQMDPIWQCPIDNGSSGESGQNGKYLPDLHMVTCQQTNLSRVSLCFDLVSSEHVLMPRLIIVWTVGSTLFSRVKSFACFLDNLST